MATHSTARSAISCSLIIETNISLFKLYRKRQSAQPCFEDVVRIYAPLRSDVEDFQLLLTDLLPDCCALLDREARVEGCCRYAASSQGVPLVLHERNERRDDQRQAVQQLAFDKRQSATGRVGA